MKNITIASGVAALAAVALAWTSSPGADRSLDSTRISDTPIPTSPSTQVSMRNVNFFVIRGAALRIRELRGEMNPTHGTAVNFDDRKSFVIRLAYAEVGLAGGDLSALMNDVVFAYKGAPLKRLRVRTSGTQLVQSGILHKGIDLPFEMTSDVSLTPEGMIRLHPTKTRILGIDGNSLMRAFGLTLEKLIDVSKAKGVTVNGNDLLLDPTAILPPPLMEGHLTGIRVEGGELVQTFGQQSERMPLEPPDTSADAFMFFKGGTLRFGKLMMIDAEMQIVGLDSGRFGFDLDRYKAQLVAGYSRTLADFGLEVFMPDVEATPRAVATANSRPKLH